MEIQTQSQDLWSVIKEFLLTVWQTISLLHKYSFLKIPDSVAISSLSHKDDIKVNDRFF